MAEVRQGPDLPSSTMANSSSFNVSLLTSLELNFRRILTIFNKNLELDNLKAYRATIADSGTANSVNTVTHGLGFIPQGFIVLHNNTAGVVYSHGRSTWTVTEMYVKCSAANAELEILVLR